MYAKIVPALAFLIACIWASNGEQCLPGQFHKKTSSPAGESYAECAAWEADTCCTANFTRKLNESRVRDLYGFHWGHCKNVSRECEKFLVEEECFFQCEPRLIRWHVRNAAILKVPVCGDYCNRWYEACKNDETCVDDWLSEFNYTGNSYICPRDSSCRTFEQRYGSGKNLCNKMWGSSFYYVDRKCPCTSLDGPIPPHVNETSVCPNITETPVCPNVIDPSACSGTARVGAMLSPLALIILITSKIWHVVF